MAAAPQLHSSFAIKSLCCQRIESRGENLELCLRKLSVSSAVVQGSLTQETEQGPPTTQNSVLHFVVMCKKKGGGGSSGYGVVYVVLEAEVIVLQESSVR